MAGRPRSHDPQTVLACAIAHKLITLFDVPHDSLNIEAICQAASVMCVRQQLAPLVPSTFRKAAKNLLRVTWSSFKKDPLSYEDVISNLIRDFGIAEDDILKAAALFTQGAEDATQFHLDGSESPIPEPHQDLFPIPAGTEAVLSHQVQLDAEQESTSEHESTSDMVFDVPGSGDPHPWDDIEMIESRFQYHTTFFDTDLILCDPDH